jgi:hypothetical protein
MMTLEFWQANTWLLILVIAAFFAAFGTVWEYVFGEKAKLHTYSPVRLKSQFDRSTQEAPKHFPAE